MAIRLVAGLGNPGAPYAGTRHNVGYRVVDLLKEAPPAGVRLFKPASFMNTSGVPIGELARRNGIAPAELLVVCDDFSLPLGRLRIRREGSAGGHHGLESILEVFATRQVPRLRVGIGPVPEGKDPADFVLENFKSPERKSIETMIEAAAQAVRLAAAEGLEKAMNRFNPEPKS